MHEKICKIDEYINVLVDKRWVIFVLISGCLFWGIGIDGVDKGQRTNANLFSTWRISLSLKKKDMLSPTKTKTKSKNLEK